MAGFNSCSFIGNLGQDPDVRTFDDGNSVATFSIACNETWKDKQTGEKRESVEWVRCVARRGLADVVARHLVQGKQVFVNGKLKTRTYTDKNGNEQRITEVVLRDLVMLGGREDGAAAGQTGKNAVYRNPAFDSPPPHSDKDAPGFDDDDSLPF